MIDHIYKLFCGCGAFRSHFGSILPFGGSSQIINALSPLGGGHFFPKLQQNSYKQHAHIVPLKPKDPQHGRKQYENGRQFKKNKFKIIQLMFTTFLLNPDGFSAMETYI